MKLVMIACVAALLPALASPQVAAQSVAEIARREKARREALAAKAAAEDASPKVYTNADLRGGGRLTTGTVQARPEAVEAEAPESEAPSADEDTSEPAGPLTEAQWRSRMDTARQELERAELLADALQNRVDGLWADFTARDNPLERADIERQRLAALDELDATIDEIDGLTQQIADFQEEARRASVPPGWLR